MWYFANKDLKMFLTSWKFLFPFFQTKKDFQEKTTRTATERHVYVMSFISGSRMCEVCRPLFLLVTVSFLFCLVDVRASSSQREEQDNDTRQQSVWWIR